jgi:ABC-type sugar transport system permease subunit
VQLFRSWLVYDSNIQGFGLRRVNWNTVRGLALATAISVGVWAGVGLMFARIWK